MEFSDQCDTAFTVLVLISLEKKKILIFLSRYPWELHKKILHDVTFSEIVPIVQFMCNTIGHHQFALSRVLKTFNFELEN